MILCCNKCGSTKVQVQAWIDANTNEYIEDVGVDTAYCSDCDDFVRLEEKDETD